MDIFPSMKNTQVMSPVYLLRLSLSSLRVPARTCPGFPTICQCSGQYWDWHHAPPSAGFSPLGEMPKPASFFSAVFETSRKPSAGAKTLQKAWGLPQTMQDTLWKQAATTEPRTSSSLYSSGRQTSGQWQPHIGGKSMEGSTGHSLKIHW